MIKVTMLTQIVIPYRGESPAPETLEALLPQIRCGQVWVKRMPSHSSYHALFAEMWGAGETWINVEHDIVPHPGALEELWECPEPWCAFGYLYRVPQPIIHFGLGCVKFGGSLLREFPDVIEATSEEATDVHPRNHWCNLDDRIKRQLAKRRVQMHQHWPPVRHLNTGLPSHGCIQAVV